MSGVFKKAQINSIPDAKQLAKMVEPVITQQLGMDLQLVVALVNIHFMILRVGANNYFLLQHMAALQQTISR